MQKLYGQLCIILIFLSVFEISSAIGHFFLVRSVINELLGPSNTYRVPGSFRNAEGCIHAPIKLHMNIKEMSKFTTCFLEATPRGNIPLYPDHGKRADQVIRDHGYELVTYDNITSVDGYIQTMFRIKGSPASPPRHGKPGVLLMHGTVASSDAWFLTDEKSLPFLLANAGYEVWIPNVRGTDYSRRHVKLDANRDFLEYWNFTYHEISVYDFPSYINLMLAETGTQKVFYIGYSLGGIVYPAALAELPDLNDKIHASFLYGQPFGIDITTPARLMALMVDLSPRFQELLNWVARGRVGFTARLNRRNSQFCSSTALRCGFCGNALFGLTGYDIPQVKYNRIPDILSRVPNAISLKYWIHVWQNFRSCRFQKFDYGPGGNIKLYGQSIPPLYNLSNLHAPLYLYYGDMDDISPRGDVERFRDALPLGTVKAIRRVNWTLFNHYDFSAAKDADILVYQKIIDDMQLYNNLMS